LIQLNFYDEKAFISTPQSYSEFKEVISQKYLLDPEDVDELIIYFLDRTNDKLSILNQNDYEQALNYQSNETKLNISFVMNIFLEVSEKSKLYQREFEASKLCTSIPLVDDIDAKKKEQLKNEILEKERQLKELTEKAELDKKKKEEEKKQKEKEEEKIKQLITESVTNSVNKSFELIKNELIQKAVKDALENYKNQSQPKQTLFIEDILKIDITAKSDPKYRKILREMRDTFDLRNFSDEKILEAIAKGNGKVDEALALLF